MCWTYVVVFCGFDEGNFLCVQNNNQIEIYAHTKYDHIKRLKYGLCVYNSSSSSDIEIGSLWIEGE